MRVLVVMFGYALAEWWYWVADVMTKLQQLSKPK